MQNVACVHVSNHHRPYKIDRKKISHIVTEISRRLGVAQYEICLQFVSPRKMQALNKKYRHQDKSTDVLSFPQYSWKRALKVKSTPTSAVKILNPLPLGDVIICADEAENNAQETGRTLDKEVCFLLVHGILHLVGHDHMKTPEKKRMFTEQRKLMRFFSGGKSKEPAWKYCIKSNKSPHTRKKTKTKANSPKAIKRKLRTVQK